MPSQDQLLREFSSSIGVIKNELTEKPKRICLKITNEWKEYQSISFGFYIDIEKDDIHKNLWEISISFHFIWNIRLSMVIGKI